MPLTFSARIKYDPVYPANRIPDEAIMDTQSTDLMDIPTDLGVMAKFDVGLEVDNCRVSLYSMIDARRITMRNIPPDEFVCE